MISTLEPFGWLDQDIMNGVVSGWVFASVDAPIVVEFFCDEISIGQHELTPLANGSSKTDVFSFSWRMPPHTRDGARPVLIEALFSSSGVRFHGKARSEPMRDRFEGIVTDLRSSTIFGFARDIVQRRPLVIAVFTNSALVALGVTGSVCDRFIPDGFQSEDGFAIPIPGDWRQEISIRFEVFIANSQFQLSQSPVYGLCGHRIRDHEGGAVCWI